MSRSQNSSAEDGRKIPEDAPVSNFESAAQGPAVPDPPAAKPDRLMVVTHSDGSVIKSQGQTGLKQKLVNKVKSWSRGAHGADKTACDLNSIALDLEGLALAGHVPEGSFPRSDLMRAKDSLENMSISRHDKTVNSDAAGSKAFSHSNSRQASQDRRMSEAPHSDSSLVAESLVDSNSRVLTWDPWNKLGRKNKKDNKKRRTDKSPLHPRVSSQALSTTIKNIDITAGDEVKASTGTTMLGAENPPLACQAQEAQESYEYQPYRSHRKSVDFVNEVLVVYFTADEVVTKGTEPLKKELEQQVRNKEMRRGHVPCTMMGKRELHEDYMAAWLKK